MNQSWTPLIPISRSRRAQPNHKAGNGERVVFTPFQMKHFFKLLPFLFFAGIVLLVSSCEIYENIQKGKTPKYELGEHKGAEFCGTCHQEIYQKWLNNSAHALATVNSAFLGFKEKFTGSIMYNAMMGEEMCYACHGEKIINAGVDCETCHGRVIPNVSKNQYPSQEAHIKKFTPDRREILKKPDFCPKCHTMQSMTGDFILSLEEEWKQTQAAADGVTCQGCHMKPRESKLAYHGFDSLSRNVGIYRDQVVIKDVGLDFPEFHLAIENRVTGHAIPASGPSRVLVLEISFLDSDGKEVHNIKETFKKKYKLFPLFGIMPNELIENTQLQAGEVRPLKYRLPENLKEKALKARFLLKFYDVSDDHQGDITKAHSISDPFLDLKVEL